MREHDNNLRPGSAGDSLEALIEQALATSGGPLMIGRGGFTLYCARGCFCSGYASDEIKRLAIAKGLPVIDSRGRPSRRSHLLWVADPSSRWGRSPMSRPITLCHAPRLRSWPRPTVRRAPRSST